MTIFTIDAFVVSLLIGTVLPILVGIVTKMEASSTVKALSLLSLSAVTGLVNGAVTMDGTAVFSKESLILAGVAWVSAVASYYGVLKPAEVSTRVQESTAELGIG